MNFFKLGHFSFLSFLFLLIIVVITLFKNVNTAYANTTAYVNFQTYVQSTNMINPTNILNTAGTGTSTNCLSFSCWSIRVSNPNVTGIPANATITSMSFQIFGTGGPGFIQVLMGENSTYCLTSPFVGDISTGSQSSNGFLTSSGFAFDNCVPNSFPATVSDLPNFFLEINAPKNDAPTPYAFINPVVSFTYTASTLTSTPTLTPTPTPTPTPIPRQIVFVHGITTSFRDVENGTSGFKSLLLASDGLPGKGYATKVFPYYQDRGYLNNTQQCDPQPTPDTNVGTLYTHPDSIGSNICDSQSAIAYNSASLDDFLSSLPSPVAIIDYSMGAAITRGWMTLAQSRANDSKIGRAHV